MSGRRLFTTWSGLPLRQLYESQDNRSATLGRPGEYPFTRGVFAEGYRDKLWITRNLTGLLSPQASNARLKFLLEQGQNGLALVPDMPTQLGLDGDHPMAQAAVGTQGVPLTSLADMEALLEGLPLDNVTASFSVPGTPAAVTMAQYVIAARKRGVADDRIRGSIQNDPLQARFCCYDAGTPLDLALRLSTDTIQYSVGRLPNWHPLIVNAYDLRESGVDAIQEIAFAFSIAFAYMDELCRRGLGVDDFAHRVMLVCGVHIDIFEEAAKFRAARRVWARAMKERYGACKERSMALRLAAHSCGSSLTAQEPINNVVRGAYESLAAVLGGVQALDLSCYDEGVALPSELAATVALKTQQILAVEVGAANTVDPLGGSYFVEALTDQLEEKILGSIREIDQRGGMLAVADSGWFAFQLGEASQRLHSAIDSGARKVVGVNLFATPGDYDRLLCIDAAHLNGHSRPVRQCGCLRDDRQQRSPRRII